MKHFAIVGAIVCLAGFGGIVVAQEAGTPGDGVPGSHAGSGYRLVAGAGLGFFSMDAFNTFYIDHFAEPTRLFDSHIDKGVDLSLALEKEMSNKIDVGLGLRFLRSSQDAVDPDDQFPSYLVVAHSLSMNAIAPFVRVSWKATTNPILFRLGVEATVCHSWFDIIASQRGVGEKAKTRLLAKGIGFAVSGGPSIPMSRRFSLGLEFGYRYLDTRALEGFDGEWELEGESITADFTGPYAQAVLEINL